MAVFLSIMLYVFVGVICMIASNTAKRAPKISFWIIVIFLTLLAGLRASSVGVDTPGYIDLLSKLRDGYVGRLNNITEPGFIFLSYVIVNLTEGYTWLLLAFSFITNYFMIKRLFELRDEISFPWAMFIYLCQYYFMTFNTMRQWIATAIIFYFSKHIGKGKKGGIIYILAVAAATLFHKTALIAAILLPAYYFLKKSTTRLNQLFKIAIVAIAPVAFIVLLDYMQKHYGGAYGSISASGNLSFITLARLALVLILVVLSSFKGAYALIVRDGSESAEEIEQSNHTLIFNHFYCKYISCIRCI